MEYGREMMRYGFHEEGMPGGSNKYPGYDRYLDDDTIKKLNAEQEAFIKATEEFRQKIYEKELFLKAELAKKDPDTATALGFQKNISEARGKFEQKMIEHLMRMKNKYGSLKKIRPGVNSIVIIINKLGLMMTRKPTYEELEKEVKELKEESADRKQMERALQKSSEEMKLFAYSVSHDLKSPAIGLYGLTKRLYKDYADILDEKGKKYCEQILKTAEQIAALIEQINIFISTKEAPLTIERLALKEVLQVIREEFSSQLSIRKIRWSEPDYIPEIKADRLCMIRALRNLVDNALKYGGEALSEINIKYRGSGGSHILSIKDNGLGLKEQDSHQDIFAPFIRRKTSKGIQGSGLGLNIVREIAEKHGGEVWLEPGRERGITFYISIPKNLQL